MRRAAPTPCRARAAISASMVGARAHSPEAIANQTTPHRKTRRRPNRSPSDPPSSSRPARVSAYALTIHWSPPSPASRSSPMVGRATLTTVASRNAIPDPSTVARSTQRPAVDA